MAKVKFVVPPDRQEVLISVLLNTPVKNVYQTFTEHSIYQSVDDRDGMLQSDMESGFSEGMERLEALVGGKAHA
jgi:uncharacterized protein YndB with AHSA1/START domain